jgi:hypothetical protein
MLGEFNLPNYDWINSTPLPNSYYYNKIKGNSIHTATCFLDLDPHNNSALNRAPYNPVFINISDLLFLIFPQSLQVSAICPPSI